MASLTAPRDRGGFKIAIVCAIPLEAEKVIAVFDRWWEAEGKRYSKAVGDQNTYTTGAIGRHNVVLVHMPKMGSTSAALSAAGLRSSFPQVKLALVVGICGVAPVHAKTQEEIVLGDIVISTAVVQYDFGRQYPNGFERKKGPEDSLGRSSPEIRSILNMLQIRQNRQRLTEGLRTLLYSDKLQEKNPEAVYPGAAQDWLYEASYAHQHRDQARCDVCHDRNETCPKPCDELGCGNTNLIVRSRHSASTTQSSQCRPEHVPAVHFGRFGSANTVMKSGIDRDRLVVADELVAFEMEGAGIWEQHPTIIIKAACDYADSHKSKKFQKYAATIAAAFLKVFLDEWNEADQTPYADDSSSPVCHIPFDELPNFIGRKNELTRVKQKLLDTKSRRIVAVLGLGGVGKTRLALELAYTFLSENPHYAIFWVQATDQLTFENDMLEIGKKLKIPGIDDAKADLKSLVKKRLSDKSEHKWVMILDSADDETLWEKRLDSSKSGSSLVDYLPKTTYGAILVTTRTRRVATFLAGKEVMELNELSQAEAIEMLTHGLEDTELAADQEENLVLVEKLTYLPLAITQAISYLNRAQESVSTYLMLLDQTDDDIIELLSQDFEETSGYQRALTPVATTWLVSFRQIREKHPLAATYLAYMACLRPKSIPLSLLPLGKPIHVTAALAVLKGYSFVRKQTSESSDIASEPLYDLHRLVHLCTRSWLKQEGQLIERTIECLRNAAKVFPADVGWINKDQWITYLPHVEHLCMEACVIDAPERYVLLQRLGRCSVHKGMYREAVDTHQTVLRWKEANLSATDAETFIAAADLGISLDMAGSFSEAETLLRRALDGFVLERGREDIQSIQAMHSLAINCIKQGRYSEAENLQTHVVEISKRVLGPEHPDALAAIGDLAAIYSYQDRHVEAEELHSQALEIQKRVLGLENPNTSISMGNLALDYSNQGRCNEAEHLDNKVLEIRTRVLGLEHPLTLLGMNQLARSYSSQDRPDQAEELHKQVLEIQKRVLGPEHLETLNTEATLASCCFQQGRFAQAENMHTDSMEVCKRVLGPEHPATLTVMYNLAWTYRALQRYDEAQDLMARCKASYLKVLGRDHPRTRDACKALDEWEKTDLGPSAQREDGGNEESIDESVQKDRATTPP